jgi:hypothetical protein
VITSWFPDDEGMVQACVASVGRTTRAFAHPRVPVVPRR